MACDVVKPVVAIYSNLFTARLEPNYSRCALQTWRTVSIIRGRISGEERSDSLLAVYTNVPTLYSKHGLDGAVWRRRMPKMLQQGIEYQVLRGSLTLVEPAKV